MPSPSWAGTKAALKERNYDQKLDGITEYWEVWTGKKDDVAWPAYVIGATITPTFGSITLPTLNWYSINAEAGKNKDLAMYTAKASDRFDTAKAKWSLDNAIDSVAVQVGAIHASLPFVCPVVQKVSWYVTVPAVFGIGLDTPVPPFTLPPTNQPPSGVFPVGFNGVYAWFKTNCDPSFTPEGWQLTERWRWMRIV